MPNDPPDPQQSTPPGVAADAGAKLYVVGIGASAGGLDALQTFFGLMPYDAGVALVVVMHLSPEHESHLVELLQPFTKMPVRQVTSTMQLEANHVYVIPPNANLNTIDTHLRLSELEARRSERAPIDHFLRTLAAVNDGASVGVILTGAGSDGSLGMRQIKECGGLTIAQDPAEAEFDSMPLNAIATGTIDLVLPLRDIPGEIVRFCATVPRLPVPDGNDTIGSHEDHVLQQIFLELRLQTRQEPALYTRATVLKRVRKRMQLHHVNTLQEYLQTLRVLPSEARALVHDLLMTVTEFFREPHVFAHLERCVLPELLDLKHGEGERLRAWSIGCSTGEEAYSLAMLMMEAAGQHPVPTALQVFATDLSDESLTRARSGLYPEEVGGTIAAERLRRFFTHESGHYSVRREVRDMVVFANHNLFKDPPYAHLDLIVCRNLLCELQPVVRRGVLSLFHYALEPHGLLLVGARDEIDAAHLFTAEGDGGRWFRRRSGPSQPFAIPAAIQAFASAGPRDEPATAAQFRDAFDVTAVHRAAIQSYEPASVLVDADNQVLNFSPRSSRYVHIGGGELTRDILGLVREPLRSQLSAGISVVRRDGRPWKSPIVTVSTEFGHARVATFIDPVPSAIRPGLLLVVFHEELAASVGVVREGRAGLTQVECELERANDRLRSLLDANQLDSRELVESNRDLHSSNEELRTALEELQSSREELQAVNEELTTLDDENGRRLNELAQISSDLQHLLESTGIATLFLDPQLRIVRFTPQLAQLFHVRHTDIGRPLSDLTYELQYPQLEDDARLVLEHLNPIDREVVSAGGRWYLSRMLPYRSAPETVDGVVLTFIDITDRKRAEWSLREADRRKDEFLAMLAHELRNPLAPITTGIFILTNKAHEPRIVEQVTATMARQAQQLVRLVDDLLEVSRIRGGKLRLQKSVMQLQDVMRDAVAAVRPLMETSGHELSVDVSEEPIVVDADPARLTQVVSNLLNNAARYTPQGGRIELVVRRENTNALIIVRDNGIGIEPGALLHVFEMFYQVSDSRQNRSSGLGIGLTLAKSLVEMHGGSITVDSAGVDRGTQFQVRLPVHDAALPVAAERARDQRPCEKRRVLIVDDNTDAAQTLEVLMTTIGGHDVHTASSGVEGLQIAEELRPEIILLDLMMPGMDGYEVARRIRRESWGRDVKLVALTGWAQEEHRRRAQDAGFDQHLTKPADVATIEALLSQQLAGDQSALRGSATSG